MNKILIFSFCSHLYAYVALVYAFIRMYKLFNNKYENGKKKAARAPVDIERPPPLLPFESCVSFPPLIRFVALLYVHITMQR